MDNIMQMEQSFIEKKRNGKIRTKARDSSGIVIKITVGLLLLTSVMAFFYFNYKNINLYKAIEDTLNNIRTVFLSPHLTYGTIIDSLFQLLITFCLGALSTITGAVIALFASLLCAHNISNNRTANIIKGIVSIIRAVPTILWVLIFAVSAGLGSLAAVIGLTFHSAGYLTKVYAESIEEVDYGTIEALKASGAGFWQIVCQAVWPASLSYMAAWTFMRFEINFANAVAIGAAAGAGGIGYNLYMAGNFYFDLREMGYLTYIIVIAVIILEIISTKIKAKVK